MRHSAFLVCLVVLSALVSAGAAPLPDDLARAAKEFDDAQMHRGGEALSRLLADDYVLVNSRGLVENKANFIADYTAAGFNLAPYIVREPIERVWGDGAVLGGLVTLSGTSDGKPFRVDIRFADIWAKRNGKWQVIYTGATRAAVQPAQ
jgi:hypothetical protein